MYRDLFDDGYTDLAICQPTYLREFYHSGFNTTERNYEMKQCYPERFIVNGSFDPCDWRAGLDYIDEQVEKR